MNSNSLCTASLLVSILAWAGVVTASPARADCLAPASSSIASIKGFVSDPSSLLRVFPQGSNLMSGKVSEIASSSQTMLPLLRKIIPQANALQAAAIGSGLARAAQVCTGVSSDLARAISDLALGAGSQEVARGFVENADDSKGQVSVDDSASANRTSGRRTPGVAIFPDAKKLPDPFKAIPIRKP